MILHLLAESVWRDVADARTYLPDSFDDDGFVHCTEGDETMLAVANALYADTDGELVVLDVDEGRLTSEVRWEVADPAPPGGLPAGTLFPHVYGPLNLDAVKGVRRLVRGAGGQFVAYAPID